MLDSFAFIEQIAEQKIAEAQRNGEFDDLPGKGRPLQLEDDSHLPPELRLGYKILKNAGYVSPEVEQRKEIANIMEMLENCEDEQLGYQQLQKLNYLVTKINEQRKTPIYLEEDQLYYHKVVQRISVRKKEKA
ncbi:MAG: DnaJ family domain-containing protein [Thermodesulfobacteriota bacterium]